MSDNTEYVRIAAAVVLPTVGGFIGSFSSAKNTKVGGWYDSLQKPWWTPPKWVFGPMWTYLYASMGYASYLVWKDGGKGIERLVYWYCWTCKLYQIIIWCVVKDKSKTMILVSAVGSDRLLIRNTLFIHSTILKLKGDIQPVQVVKFQCTAILGAAHVGSLL